MKSINPNHYYWRVLFRLARIQGYSLDRISEAVEISKPTLSGYSKFAERFIPNPYMGFELIQYFQQILPPHLFRLGVKPEFET